MDATPGRRVPWGGGWTPPSWTDATGERGCSAHTDPILAARTVTERAPHAAPIGSSALAASREAGPAFEDPLPFFTRAGRDALRETPPLRVERRVPDDPPVRHGMRSAVARPGWASGGEHLDGSTTGRMPGRGGDTPVIGAGGFADDATCAVSGTARAGVFMQRTAAAEIAARMRHGGQSLTDAARHAVMADPGRNDGSRRRRRGGRG